MIVRPAKEVTGYTRGVPCKIKVTEIAPGKWLEVKAADAYRAMAAQCVLDIGLELNPNSAWRSYEHQERLYNAWTKGPKPAKPGYSGHHNGVAVDIQRSHGDTDGDGVNEIDEWLDANAHHFGFFKTVRGEPWHWQYLGLQVG